MHCTENLLLENKVVVITGGSGGIGRALAVRFAKAKAKVVVLGSTKSRVEKCVEELVSYTTSAVGFCVDVSSPKEVEKTFSQILDTLGEIHVLINGAGIQGPIGLLIDNSLSDWIRTLEVNLIGTVLCIRAVLPSMIKAQYGKIINFSGGGATSPRARFSAYGTSKAGVVRLTEILAQEVRSYHIDVNAIAPGAVNTRMLDEVLNAGEALAGEEYQKALRQKKEGGTSPEWAAELALFLASPLSDGITGKLISAIWDPWQDKAFQEKLRSDPDLATLRRIDEKHFTKIKNQ